MNLRLSVSKKHLRDPKYKLWEKAKQDQNSDVGHQERCRANEYLTDSHARNRGANVQAIPHGWGTGTDSKSTDQNDAEMHARHANRLSGWQKYRR